VKKVTVADKEYKVISPTNFAAARDLFANQGIKVMGTTPLPAAYGALAGQYLSTEYAAKIAATRLWLRASANPMYPPTAEMISISSPMPTTSPAASMTCSTRK
jgi:hypothetical protein